MRQYAWLELYEGLWCLTTEMLSGPTFKSRKWDNKDAALRTLSEEGWSICGEYPNWLSDKAGLPHDHRGYALKRTVH